MKLTLSWRRPLSYRNQYIDLLRKSIDWFIYDNGLRHEIVKKVLIFSLIMRSSFFVFLIIVFLFFKYICAFLILSSRLKEYFNLIFGHWQNLAGVCLFKTIKQRVKSAQRI